MSNLLKYTILFFSVSISLIVIVYFWRISNIEIKNITLRTNPVIHNVLLKTDIRIKNPLVGVKGIYLTAYSAGSKKKMDSIIDLINKTELNAVIIDIKDYSGYILYDSNVSLVNNLKLEVNRLGDVSALIKKLHDNNIYVIARQTVFQDPILAKNKLDWAIHRKGGGIWRDHKGLAWVDPTKKEVWQYNVDIAKEAINLGFDEINFDYVRFPSDGNISRAVYSTSTEKKYLNMREFYEFISDSLKEYPAWISLDLFGFVMEKTGEDDMNIGQRLVDGADFSDYVCPMMYPSHYPVGHLGLSNPAANPRMIFANGFKKGAPQVEGRRAKIRPWLQAFNIGAVYGAEKIRAQIDETEKHSDAGWLLWNASNRYTAAGLKLEKL